MCGIARNIIAVDNNIAGVGQLYVFVVIADELIVVSIVASVKMYVSGFVIDIATHSQVHIGICAGTAGCKIQSTDEIAGACAYHYLVSECYIAGHSVTVSIVYCNNITGQCQYTIIAKVPGVAVVDNVAG